MAEAAAIAYGVVEAVETTAQLGVGAYMVAKPTMPLKATFMQIATSSDDGTRLSLARSDHTVTVVGNKAYIFGGETAAGKLASNELHIVKLDNVEGDTDPDYSVIAALPSIENGSVPTSRTKHAACLLNDDIVIYGGVDHEGKTIDEESQLWLFNTKNRSWEGLPVTGLHAEPQIRRSAKLFQHGGDLFVYGGVDSSGQALKDVWSYDSRHKLWSQFPEAPVATTDAAIADGVLYLVSPNDNISSDVHFLPLTINKEGELLEWTTEAFPTSPLTPGPKPRTDSGLLAISTGYGRNYLAYIFGQHPESIPEPGKAAEKDDDTVKTAIPTETSAAEAQDLPFPRYHSDTWTYQIASSQPQMKATTQIYEAIKPAAIKDAIRGALGVGSGKHSWGEVEVVPPADLTNAAEGKVHPGPRARFGADVMADSKGVVLWGGVNAKGEREGDGWVIRFE